MTSTFPTTNPSAASALAEVDGFLTSPRRAAKIAGVGYVVLFVLGIFANFFVREGLIVAGDAGATATQIGDSEGLFRLGLVSFMVVFVIDVVVAWALYIVFRSANRDVSLLAAWFRIVYTVFLGVALIFFFQALQLLSAADFLAVIEREQLDAHALVALDTFNSTWLIGLVVFGVHLAVLGYLIITSGRAPKALGWLLVMAGMAYVADTTAHALLGNYEQFEMLFLVVVAVPSIIGEGWFGLWLLLEGGSPEVADTTSRSVVHAG
jgi:hypothetical protein